MLKEAAQAGADPHALCRGLGFTAEDLETPGFLVSHLEATTVVRRTLSVIKTPDLGLELGMRGNLANLGVLALGLMASATVGEALRLVLRYPGSAGLLVALGEERSGHQHVLTASSLPGAHDIEPLAVDVLFGGLVRLGRQGTGASYSPTRVELVRPRPPEPQRYEAYFGCPVLFGAPRNQLISAARWMDHPLPTANLTAFRSAEQWLQSQATESGDSAIGLAVARVVRKTLPLSSPSAEVASTLLLSGRTMRRRLKQSGQSFRKMQDEERKSRALALVVNSQLELRTIALETGFADLSSFRRAFKRWTGCTPTEMRAQKT